MAQPVLCLVSIFGFPLVHFCHAAVLCLWDPTVRSITHLEKVGIGSRSSHTTSLCHVHHKSKFAAALVANAPHAVMQCKLSWPIVCVCGEGGGGGCGCACCVHGTITYSACSAVCLCLNPIANCSSTPVRNACCTLDCFTGTYIQGIPYSTLHMH